MTQRENYGRLKDLIDTPDLIEIQTKSYDDFLQHKEAPEKRKHQGMQEAFVETFPDRDGSDGRSGLEFVRYELSEPKTPLVDCLKDGGTYQVGLNVVFRLRSPNNKDVREERIYMGDMPMMTDRGSFVINGAERVIVSQLHRSPGVCFESTRHPSGKILFSYKIIADHGAWLEVHFDINDLMHIYLDRKRRRRKFLICTFLRAFGFDGNLDILDAVYRDYRTESVEKLRRERKEELASLHLTADVFGPADAKGVPALLAAADSPVTPALLKSLAENGVDELMVYRRYVQEVTLSKLPEGIDLSHLFVAEAIMHPNPPEGEPATVLVEALDTLSEKAIEVLKESGVKKVTVVDTSHIGDYFVYCLQKDATRTAEDAQKEIYKRMRPAEPLNAAHAKSLFTRLFEDQRRYDLGLVGRFKMNQRLGINVKSDVRILTKTDVAAATAYLMRLRKGDGQVDDIDHLGRRRVRTVGELLQNQCRIGLARTANFVRERLNSSDINPDDVSISKLVSNKMLASVIRDFFGRNQLSQFMDQTNCLAELTNKRRLSALGPGGLTRERAGFDVRDVHPSHYGRICPIETPEGPNIGLISSLALYGRIDEFGFIKTPYRRVQNRCVTNEVEYLTADQEEDFIIAQANAELNEKSTFSKKYVLSRLHGDSGEFMAEDVQYMDISPKQLISAAAGLIPFLEHDDANRALMGSNMQRQAVPLLKAERPLVGTGLEHEVARDSRAIVLADEDGIVASANAERIIVTPDGKLPERPNTGKVYNLYKFLRSNASTLINQHPIVKRGDKVRKGQTIADGASTDGGELALGRNVTVAFMSWHGYNFEDAIIISERLVSEDVYTSVHVSLEDVIARETKLGPEEITRDIPNVGEEALRNLDTEGVVRIGAEVNPGDILVGKITPKSESDLAPEERLLKAIFGEKAADVKDTSLKVSGGCSGIVMDVRIERRADPNKSRLSKQEVKARIKEAENRYRSAQNSILDEMVKVLSEEFLGKKLSCAITRLVADEPEELIASDRKITRSMLARLAANYDSYIMRDCEEKTRIDEIIKGYRSKLRDNDQCRIEEIQLIDQNEGQEAGQIKSVKVYIASKHRLSVGDKMAGRHGNKGIVAKIVPVADMPFMADGTPVDIVLNPLGVPSRMNVGQVFETHVGWAAKVLGKTIASPVFDGIKEDKIVELLAEARRVKVQEQGWKVMKADPKGGCETEYVVDDEGRNRDDCFIGVDGKTRLFDGRTGEAFTQRIMVGQIYMLKLDHLVANKIHARAVGPYSLVTQQPLGGKAQHGGQRFGEMEVWALEAYGAAYTLQEMLTVKSDDVTGRTKIYESIMRGDNSLVAGTPESFNVLMNEMRSLCLDVRVNQARSILA
ncbi:MAG TPA: DNA-directed RNA polymerase subunit beta [Lentisphaeria bacterium]|nr:DNA-directed RNA polymerase subunit beta [Lentisphaeria bacterium]